MRAKKRAQTRGTAESTASTQVKDGGGWKDCTHFPSLVDKPNTTESMDLYTGRLLTYKQLYKGTSISKNMASDTEIALGMS